MQGYLCYNPWTKERRILAEPEAFNLDKRVWRISVWNCTSGHEVKAERFPAVVSLSRDCAPLARHCGRCGAPHCDNDEFCEKKPYRTYLELREVMYEII